MKKYSTLGAILAGSALLFSCDGDDGKDGAPGAPGAPGAGGGGNLTNAELTNTAFIAANLRMVLDPSTDVLYPGTPEIFFDYSSDQLAFYNGGLGSAEGLLINQLTANGTSTLLPQVRMVGLDAPADGTFYIAEIVGDTNADGAITLTGVGRDAAAFSESDFTVTQIIQNTYLGTFTTLVGLETTGVTLSQNAPAVIGNPGAVVAPAGYFFVDAQQQVDGGGLPVVVQTNTITRENLITLASTVVAIRFREIGQGPETDIVFGVLSPLAVRPDGTNVDLSGFASFDVANVVNADEFVATATPQRIITLSDQVFATGQFRLDVDSTQGGDASNLPLN